MTNNPEVMHLLAPMREGGLERVVTMLATGQKNAAHVAAVVEPDSANGHPFIARLEALGVPVTTIAVGARGYLREYRTLAALVARLHPTILHTHGYRADVIGAAIARAHRIPIVSTVHGFTGGGPRNRLYERMQTVALRRFDAVIAVSAALVQRLEKSGVSRGKIHLIPNGFAPMTNRPSRSTAREKLGIQSDGNIVAWIGRLSPEKGADVMLDALAATDRLWQLSIIGEGPERENLHRQASDLGIESRVTWHGAVSNASSLLPAFDAFVLSSRTEGTPITLLEAMDAAVPIVATAVGGVPDVVSSAEAIVVPPEQPQRIASALAELLRDPAAAAQRSAAARERLLRSFGAASWLAAISGVYGAATKSFRARAQSKR